MSTEPPDDPDLVTWARTQSEYLTAEFLASARALRWIVVRPGGGYSTEIALRVAESLFSRAPKPTAFVVLAGASDPVATVELLARLTLPYANEPIDGLKPPTVLLVTDSHDESHLAATLQTHHGRIALTTNRNGDEYGARLLALATKPDTFEHRWWPLRLSGSEPPFASRVRRWPLTLDVYSTANGPYGRTIITPLSIAVQSLLPADRQSMADALIGSRGLDLQTPLVDWQPLATVIGGWMLSNSTTRPKISTLSVKSAPSMPRSVNDVFPMVREAALCDLVGAPRPSGDPVKAFRSVWSRRVKVAERIARDPMLLQSARRSIGPHAAGRLNYDGHDDHDLSHESLVDLCHTATGNAARAALEVLHGASSRS